MCGFINRLLKKLAFEKEIEARYLLYKLHRIPEDNAPAEDARVAGDVVEPTELVLVIAAPCPRGAAVNGVV